MDESLKRDSKPKNADKHYSSGGTSLKGRPPAGSAARSLPTPERNYGGTPAGAGSTTPSTGDLADTVVHAPSAQLAGSDRDLPPQSTKPPVVFRQVTVEKQNIATASPKESAIAASSGDARAKTPAEEAADNLEATRLLSAEQLAGTFSKPPKDRPGPDLDSAIPSESRPDPASFRENEPQQFRGSLPRFAAADEPTQYFRLSVPEHGPIRGEPALADDEKGQPQISPDPGRPPLHSAAGKGLKTPEIPPSFTKGSVHGDTALGAVQERLPTSPPASHTAPGRLHAHLPALVMLNLLLTLLALAANAYLVFHVLTAGR